MSTRGSRPLAAALTILLVAFLVTQAGAAETGDKKAELEALRGRIQKLQQELAKGEESKSEVTDALQNAERAISEVNRQLTTLRRDQKQIAAELLGIKQRIRATRADVSKQQELLDRMIRHQYRNGNTDALRLILEGQDVGEVERQLQYLGYLSKARQAQIVRLKQSLVDLASLESAAQNKQAVLAANALAQQQARASLQAERQARQQVLNRIKTEIVSSRREIGRLKQNEDRLSKLVEQLSKVIVRQPGEAISNVADGSTIGRAFQSLKGRIKLPVKGELAGRFGQARESGGVTWKGLFIRAESGQAVKAVADGRVIFADWLRGFGNLLIVDHGDGYMSLYGNNESLLKTVGEAIQSGETVASTGSTGGAEEAGVYFELRHEGKPFDPMKWVGR